MGLDFFLESLYFCIFVLDLTLCLLPSDVPFVVVLHSKCFLGQKQRTKTFIGIAVNIFLSLLQVLLFMSGLGRKPFFDNRVSSFAQKHDFLRLHVSENNRHSFPCAVEFKSVQELVR